MDICYNLNIRTHKNYSNKVKLNYIKESLELEVDYAYSDNGIVFEFDQDGFLKKFIEYKKQSVKELKQEYLDELIQRIENDPRYQEINLLYSGEEAIEKIQKLTSKDLKLQEILRKHFDRDKEVKFVKEIPDPRKEILDKDLRFKVLMAYSICFKAKNEVSDFVNIKNYIEKMEKVCLFYS